MLAAVAGSIALTWAVLALILIGVGSALLRVFVREFDSADALWSGLIVCCVVLGVWYLFLPITSAVDLLLVGIAFAGLCWNRHWLAAEWREIWSRRGTLGVFGLCAGVLAFRAAGPCEYFDTGLYGAQMVRWIQTYPAVFGLANVHGRLGFNSSAFLLDAALGQGLWREFYFHLLGGFLFCVLWAMILPLCRRFLKTSAKSSSGAFALILSIGLLTWTARGVVVGTTTDEPSTVLCLAAAVVIFEELERERTNGELVSRQRLKLAIAATLLVLAVTFKLSVIVFAFLGWLVALMSLYSTRSGRRMGWVAVGTAVLVFAPWVIACVILSGYPFFPNSMLAFPGDWRVPKSIADMYELWVRSWGRTRLTTAEGFVWLRPWFHQALRDRSGFQVPMLLSGIGAGVLAVQRTMGRRVSTGGMWLLVPSVSGILFWFWKSPDPRFGQAAIWCGAATLGALALSLLIAAGKTWQWRMIAGGLCIVAAWCLFSFGWRHAYQVLEGVHEFVRLPSANVIAEKTSSGLIMYVPSTGNQCWAASLPCTIYFDRSLKLRSSLGERWGFKTEGLANFGDDPTASLAEGSGADR